MSNSPTDYYCMGRQTVLEGIMWRIRGMHELEGMFTEGEYKALTSLIIKMAPTPGGRKELMDILTKEVKA